MQTISYTTHGTCSKKIDIELDGELVKSVRFTGGCPGNLQGISHLVAGMSAKDVIGRLENIKCGNKNTSCPDQLARALKEALSK